jgi:hypothetical protein
MEAEAVSSLGLLLSSETCRAVETVEEPEGGDVEMNQ